jgi:MFS family permease
MAHAARTTYREVFAEPVFRTLFATRTLAISADTLRIVALSVLVFTTTGSALLGAIAFGAGFLPQAVGGVLLGSLSDRLPPRALITAGYALECAAALALAVIAMPAEAMLIVVASVAVLTPAFNGASARLIADRLTGDAYVVGRSVSNVASAGAQLIGLAAGGGAVALLGPKNALLTTAAAHLLAAFAVRLFLPRLDRPARVTGSALAQSWAGTRLLSSNREVRRLALIQWLPATFAVGAEALLIPYSALRRFPPSTTGLLLAAIPLGMLISGAVVGRLVRPAGREHLVAPLIATIGIGILTLVTPASLPMALAALLVVGVGFAYSLGLQRAFLDALPETHRGQGFALLSTGMMTMQGLGPVFAGAVAQLTSIPSALAVCGVATVITAAAVLTVHNRRTAEVARVSSDVRFPTSRRVRRPAVADPAPGRAAPASDQPRSRRPGPARSGPAPATGSDRQRSVPRP